MSDSTSFVNGIPSSTVIDFIWQQAELLPEKIALRYCINSKGEGDKSVTFSQLQQTICNYSKKISEDINFGEVVLLAIPDQIEFWFVLLGCMHANVIPAPLPVGETKAQRQRLKNIISDSKVSALFCIKQHREMLKKEVLWVCCLINVSE